MLLLERRVESVRSQQPRGLLLLLQSHPMQQHWCSGPLMDWGHSLGEQLQPAEERTAYTVADLLPLTEWWSVVDLRMPDFVPAIVAACVSRQG